MATLNNFKYSAFYNHRESILHLIAFVTESLKFHIGNNCILSNASLSEFAIINDLKLIPLMFVLLL